MFICRDGVQALMQGLERRVHFSDQMPGMTEVAQKSQERHIPCTARP